MFSEIIPERIYAGLRMSRKTDSLLCPFSESIVYELPGRFLTESYWFPG